MTIFTCEDSLEAMMTCVYDAWASRLGHKNVRLQTEPVGNLELFCDYKHVDSDPVKAGKVIDSIKKKISVKAYTIIYRTALSCQSEKLDLIYRFLIFGFCQGASIIDDLRNPVVMDIFKINRHVGNESHYFKEFIRFSDYDGKVLVSHIDPKNDILTLTAPHFADRLPSENWMIIDDNRGTAVVHPADQDFYLTVLSRQEMDFLSDTREDSFTILWKGFFDSIGIKERKNPRCQQTMLPLRYRKYLPEFH